MKKNSKQQIKLKPKVFAPKKYYSFPQISNQNCIRNALKLLGVTDELYEKETKVSIISEMFPNNSNAASSKTFFFIAQLCIKNLCNNQQAQQLLIWYPPRTANEQIQFKKIFFKLIQKLQSQGNLPKNIILSKTSIAGDSTNDSVIQFLRILTQFALRNLYLQKYSRNERLIQISLQDSGEGTINSFYPFPFCESATSVEAPLKGEDLAAMKNIFLTYIEIYRQKILKLRINIESQIINPQQIMTRLIEQRQIATTLTGKVNSLVFSENRAFDRRIIIDKHRQLWKEINSIKCQFLQSEPTSSVLRIQGDIAKLLQGWKTISGTHTLNQFNRKLQQVQIIKKKGQKIVDEFRNLQSKILKSMQ